MSTILDEPATRVGSTPTPGPTVYIPQLPGRFDTTLRRWVPTVNIESARRHGSIEIMFPPEASRLELAPLVAALREKMSRFTSADRLVAVGDPSLIAAAAAIASRLTGGRWTLLKWDRQMRDYIVVEMRV